MGTAIGFLSPSHYKGLLKKMCAIQARANGADFFVFTPKDVSFEEKKVKASFYKNGKVIRKTCSFPDVIIDRFRGRGSDLKYKEFYEKLSQIPISNSEIKVPLDKLKLYEYMRNKNSLSDYRIPFIELSDISDALDFIKKSGKVVLKATNSFGGKQVYLIEYKENYSVQLEQLIEKYNNEQFINFLNEKKQSGDFILQKYIDSSDAQGCPFDVRVHLLRGKEGRWHVASSYVRKGKAGAVASNLGRGGVVENIEDFLIKNYEHVIGRSIKKIKKKVENSAFEIIENIKEILPKGASDIGIDLGISKGQLYIFEVNTYLPGSTQHEQAVAKLLVDYALYVLRKNKKEEDVIGNQQLTHLTEGLYKVASPNQVCTYAIMLEGWRRQLDLKVYYEGQALLYTLSDGKSTHSFSNSRGSKVTPQSVEIVRNKQKTRELWQQENIPCPRGIRIEDIKLNRKLLEEELKELKYPIVLKPTHGSLGRGVVMNIQSYSELLKHIESLPYYDADQIIEEEISNARDFRVYVIGGRVSAAVERVPAHVIGDGDSTIIQLIEMKNKKRKKNPYLASGLINLDDSVDQYLAEQNLSRSSIPNKKETIFLKKAANASIGGETIDRTEEISHEIESLAIRAVEAIPGLAHGGVDILVTREKAYALEVNARAQIGLHLYPSIGKPRDVASDIIDYYFPESVRPKVLSNITFNHSAIRKALISGSIEEVTVKKYEGNTKNRKVTVYSSKLSSRGKRVIRSLCKTSNINGVLSDKGNYFSIIYNGLNAKKLERHLNRVFKGARRVYEDVNDPIVLGYKEIKG